MSRFRVVYSAASTRRPQAADKTAFATLPRHLASSASKIGDGVGVGSGTHEVVEADILAAPSLVIEARRRSSSSGANSILLRRPSTCRMRVASASVGSRCSRRVPSSSPSCLSAQKASRRLV